MSMVLIPVPDHGGHDHEELFREAMDQVRSGVELVVTTFNSFVETVNDRLNYLKGASLLTPITPWPSGIVLFIEYFMGQIRTTVNRAIEMVTDSMERSTPVLSLMRSSFEWITEVQTPLSDLSATVTEPRDLNMYHWSGGAASAYRDKATDQRAAVDQCSHLAAGMSEWLFSIAESNVSYAVELAGMLTDMAGKLTAALGEAATIAGLPWAVEQVSQALSALVTAVQNNLLEIGNRLVEAVGNIRELTSMMGDHRSLPGGKWPEATAG
jgi:hypothetical protein